jgi:hypothetical protein
MVLIFNQSWKLCNSIPVQTYNSITCSLLTYIFSIITSLFKIISPSSSLSPLKIESSRSHAVPNLLQSLIVQRCFSPYNTTRTFLPLSAFFIQNVASTIGVHAPSHRSVRSALIVRSPRKPCIRAFIPTCLRPLAAHRDWKGRLAYDATSGIARRADFLSSGYKAEARGACF